MGLGQVQPHPERGPGPEPEWRGPRHEVSILCLVMPGCTDSR